MSHYNNSQILHSFYLIVSSSFEIIIISFPLLLNWRKQYLLLTTEPFHPLPSIFFFSKLRFMESPRLWCWEETGTVGSHEPHSLFARRPSLLYWNPARPHWSILGCGSWMTSGQKETKTVRRKKRVRGDPLCSSTPAEHGCDWVLRVEQVTVLPIPPGIPSCFALSSLHLEWLLITNRWRHVHRTAII